MMVAPERTGWRDERISVRHREWGGPIPCCDLDFLMLEYNNEVPAALVEYKHRNVLNNGSLLKWLCGPNPKALKKLADGYGLGQPANLQKLPFLIAIYDPDSWWFIVRPLNDKARLYYEDHQFLTEQEYVRSLYKLRGHVLTAYDNALIETLGNAKPDALSINALDEIDNPKPLQPPPLTSPPGYVPPWPHGTVPPPPRTPPPPPPPPGQR